MDVDEADVAADSADEDAGEELVFSHTPLPDTNRQQDNPRHNTPEEYPLLLGGAADVEAAADITHPTRTNAGTIGMRVTAADSMCPGGTLAKLALRAKTATRRDTRAR